MKIDAKIEFSDEVAEKLDRNWIRVPVDIDYVEDNEDSVNTWVMNELEVMFSQAFNYEDFKITNMDEVLEEIKFDEFEDQIN